MKRKIYNFFITLSIIAGLLTSMTGSIVSAYSGSFVYSLFTEYDPSSKITTTTTSTTQTNSDMNSHGYTYSDMGSGYFTGDYTIESTFTTSSSTSGGTVGYFLGMANVVPDSSWIGRDEFNNTVARDFQSIYVHNSGEVLYMQIFERRSESSTYHVSSAITLGAKASITSTIFYLTYWRDTSVGTYGTMYLDVYLDEARTVLLGSTSLTLQELNSWQYYVGNLLWGWSYTGYTSTCTIGETTYYSGLAPTFAETDVPTLSWDEDSHVYKETFSGNVTSAGGDSSASVTLHLDSGQTGNFTDISLGAKTEGSAFTYDYLNPDLNTTYDYYYTVTNSITSVDTDTDNFITTVSPTVPQVSMYPVVTLPPYFYADQAYFTGIVDYDGGSNTTGSFWYKDGADGTWTKYTGGDTANLTTGQGYTGTLNITSGHTYYLRAEGTNDTGTVNSTSDISFTYTNWYAPVIYTTNAEHDTNFNSTWGNDSDITMNGYIDDDGNSDVTVKFYWRIKGEDIWTSWQLPDTYNTGDNVSYNIAGTQHSTTYEYYMSATNGALYNPSTGVTTWVDGDVLEVTTNSMTDAPSVTTVSVTHKDNYTAEVAGTITNDGGKTCTGWIQYREPNVNQNWTWGDYYADNLTSGDTFYILVNNLDYGQKYEFRAVALNSAGYGYGFVVEYTNIADTDTTTTANDNSWVASLNNVLAGYGMNNTGGKIVFVLACMIIAFLLPVLAPMKKFQEYIGVTSIIGGMFASIVMVIGMVIGYVPVVVTVCVVITVCVLISILAVRILRGSTSGGLE